MDLLLYYNSKATCLELVFMRGKMRERFLKGGKVTMFKLGVIGLGGRIRGSVLPPLFGLAMRFV